MVPGIQQVLNKGEFLMKVSTLQATLQKLKAEEYIQQKRELLALYRDRDGESPGKPSQEGSQNSTEDR